MCGPCSQCLGHTVFAPLTACVLSRSTLLRLQAALQGNCLNQALGCMHFPGLSHSGSGSQVLHKCTDSVGPVFCALPRLEQLRWPGAWPAHSPQEGSASYHLPSPSRSGSAASGVPCASSGELISHCGPPGGCQPSTGGLLAVWWRMPSRGPSLPLAFQLWLPPACNGRTSFSLFSQGQIFCCIYHIFFIHLSLGRKWDCFHILAIVNNAAVYLGV